MVPGRHPDCQGAALPGSHTFSVFSRQRRIPGQGKLIEAVGDPSGDDTAPVPEGLNQNPAVVVPTRQRRKQGDGTHSPRAGVAATSMFRAALNRLSPYWQRNARNPG